MRVSTKQSPVGKPLEPDYSSLAHNWQSPSMFLGGLVDHACKRGLPFSLIIWAGGVRRGENFIEASGLVADVEGTEDNPLLDSDVDALLQLPLIQNHAALVFDSFNSKPDARRLRVVFLTDEPIRDLAEFEALQSLLIGQIPHADPACKDGARFYFGTRPGVTPLLVQYKTLPLAAMRQELADQEKVVEPLPYPIHAPRKARTRGNRDPLNPAGNEARRREALRQSGGKTARDGTIPALCPYAHKHDAPGKHFFLAPSGEVGICHGKHGTILAKDIDRAWGIDAAAYGGLFENTRKPIAVIDVVKTAAPIPEQEQVPCLETKVSDDVALVELFPVVVTVRKDAARWDEKQRDPSAAGESTTDPNANPEPTQKKGKKKQTFAELVASLKPFKLAPFTPDATFNDRYLSPDDNPHKTTLYKSPIGTGKTELLKTMVRQHKRVLVVVHRQALARSLALRLGIPCYSDLSDEQLINADRLVICLNSLPKIVGSTLKPYDLVALDEFTQVIEHLDGDTFNGKEALEAYKYLKELVRGAGWAVALDAGMHDLACKWLQAIRGESWSTENTYRVQRGKLVLYRKTEGVVKAAIKAFKAGKTIAIACGLERSESLRLLLAKLEKAIPASAIRVINHKSSMTGETQDFLTSINDQPLPRVLIYTPSLGSGFDITQPVDAVFGIFEGTWFTAPDVMQMLGRCRNTGETHVYIPPVVKGERLEDWYEIFQRNRKAAKLTALEGDFEGNGDFVLSEAQKSLSKLLAMFEAESNRSKNNLLAHFIALAEAGGYTLELDETGSKTTREAMTEASEEYRENDKEMVLAATPVDDMELDWYKNRDAVTPEVWAGNDRYHIEKATGATITPVMYDDLYSAFKRRALYAFTDLRTHEKALQTYDKQDAENKTLPQHRKHRAPRARLTKTFFKTVFGTDDIDALRGVKERLTGDEISTRAKAWLQVHGQEINLYFDRRKENSDTPLAVTRWMLARVGLKLKRERVRDGEARHYEYWLDADTLTKQHAYSETRLAALDERLGSVPIPTSNYIETINAGVGTNLPTQTRFADTSGLDYV